MITSEAATGGVLQEKVFLEISQKFTGNHFCQSLLFNKVNLAQVFSCKFYKISKNTFIIEICFGSFKILLALT